MSNGVVLYFIVFALFLTTVSSNENNQSNRMSESGGEPRRISFCNLIRNQESYNGEIVRTEAILVSTRTTLVDSGEEYLYHPSCSDQKTLVLLEYDASYAPSADIEATLRHILSERGTDSPARARVTIVGRFETSPEIGFGHLGGFHARLVVTHIDRMKSVSPNTGWPKEGT